MESILHPTLKELVALGYTDLSLINDSKFCALLDEMQDAVVVHGADTKIITFNDRAQDILGLDKESMRGKSAADAAWNFLREDGSVMPENEYPVNQVLSSSRALKNYVVGVKQPDADEPRWVQVNAIPIFNDSDIRNMLNDPDDQAIVIKCNRAL